MNKIIKLALKNLKEHNSKTTIISLFLTFGMAIVILGNSFLESVNRGLEKDFRQNYTGDVAICLKPERGTNYDIFGVKTTSFSAAMEMPQIPALPELDKVQEIVNANDAIEKHTKLISSQVFIAKGVEMDLSELTDRDDLTFDDMPISMLFAGENGTYWNTFPDVKFIEGNYPTPNTNEVIIDTRVKKAFENLYKESLNVGDTILMAGTSMGIIREAKVVGIFNPPNENSAMFQIIYGDASLVRSFARLTYGTNFVQEIPDSIDLNLSSLDEDDMFGSDDMFAEIEEDDSFLSAESANFDDILGDTTLRDKLNETDEGAWNFILAKVKNPSTADKVVADLNKTFKEAGLNVYAMNWKYAAISYSGTVEGMGFIFNLLIIILAIVVFIIIMNTMTVSVIERTGEIGTMRAIGAEKKFVKALFNSEAILITLISAVFGIILSLIIMAIFNSFEITISNSIAKMILGGGLLHFSPTLGIIIMTVVSALLGSLISNIYPVRSALKVTPLKALSKGSE
ncbi:MAG: ABC transporter permease [Treponema sp.]|nr:ABC transporter permease [Treponema sp.]